MPAESEDGYSDFGEALRRGWERCWSVELDRSRPVRIDEFQPRRRPGQFSTRVPTLTSYPLLVFCLLEGLLQILPGFIQGALGVVVGLKGLAVLVGGAFALSGDVEDLA